MSDDGDPVEGTLLFSYSAAPVAPATTGLVAAETPAPPVVSTAPEMGRIWIVGVVIVGLAALALLLQTRRRRPSSELLDAAALDRETTEV